MIPYTSCMCFGRRRQSQWTIVPTSPQRQGNVQLVRNDNVLCIKIVERREERSRRPLTLSRSEWYLLQSVDLSMGRQMITEPFLTPQRRRVRARVPVIKPEALRSELLDDAYSEIVKCMLSNCGNWAYNTFNLDVATGGRSLSTLLVHLFQQYHFTDIFRLDIVKVWRCFNLIESCYHSSNPYHNSVHAADVTQAMHCFLQESKISACITPLEAMSALIAAVTHDLDHPGVNQPFLIATSNHLAALYKNFSVLENHHWRMAISCLRESGLFDHLDKDTWKQLESFIHSLILATDITRQQEFLCKFKGYLDKDMMQMEDPYYRHFVLQIALKCADLCNPCRPWTISEKWSQQVCLEFYKQGDFERKLQLPVTPICDRYKTSVAKIQADFFRFVVTPLFDIWNRFLQTPLSEQLTINLQHNQAHWDSQVQIKTDPSIPSSPLDKCRPASPAETTPSPPVERTDDYKEDRVCILAWSRRCSVPLTIPKLLPRTIIRRQSFPHTQQHTCFTSLALHRSPHLSLRTLSAEQLQPKTSIVSLAGGSRGNAATLVALLGGTERRLVHQPASFPPFYGRGVDAVFPPDLLDDSSLPQDQEEGKHVSVCPTTSTLQDDTVPKEDEEEKLSLSSSRCSNGCCSSSEGIEVCSVSVSNAQTVPSKEEEAVNDPPDLSPSVLEELLRSQAVEGVQPQKSRTLTRLKSENDMYEIKGIVSQQHEDDNKDPESPLLKQVSSWCSRISHSLSEERQEPPSRDFDSPSWKSSSSSLSGSSRLIGRRGSAPVTLTGVPDHMASGELRPTLRGGSGSVAVNRRWSMTTESMTGDVSRDSEKQDCPQFFTSPYGICPLRRELVRRHSFGILESLVGIASSESENESSTDPTSTGTTCSTRCNSTRCRQEERQSFSSTGDSSESHDVFPPGVPQVTTSCSLPGRRRGSLPVDIPISLVVPRIPSEPHGGLIRGSDWPDLTAALGGRRRTSAGDVLNALVGPSAALVALQEVSGHGSMLPRRSLGALEMLAGIWRSRESSTTGSQQSLVATANRFKFMDSIMADRGDCPSSSGASSGFSSVLSDHLLCQRRRGSVPIDLSLLPVSSGNASSGDPDN